MLVAAFIFLANGANPETDRKTVNTPQVSLTAIGVPDYDSAVKVAVEMADTGCEAIELCGGFGNKGTFLVSEAVKGKARVGTVKFDIHPGLDNMSGDDFYK